MRTARRGLGTVAFAAAIAMGGACLPGAGPPLNPYTDDAGQPPPSKLGDDASDLMDRQPRSGLRRLRACNLPRAEVDRWDPNDHLRARLLVERRGLVRVYAAGGERCLRE